MKTDQQAAAIGNVRTMLGIDKRAGKRWTSVPVPDMETLLGYVAELENNQVESEEDDYEYNIEGTDLVTGETRLWRKTWEPKPDWLRKKVDERNAYDDKLRNAGGSPEYTRRLVKRRKAGKVQGV